MKDDRKFRVNPWSIRKRYTTSFAVIGTICLLYFLFAAILILSVML